MRKIKAATINRSYPINMKDDRLLLKKKACGRKLVYEVYEKTSEGNKRLGTCRIYWVIEKGKEYFPVAKVMESEDRKLKKNLQPINEIVQRGIKTKNT